MARPDRAALEDHLRQGLTQQAADWEGLPVAALLDYLELLLRWNRTYNLTAVRDPLAMVNYHLLDSLAVLPYLKGRCCLDLGTGAGLPGLVLALARPDQHWTLIDSNIKKTRFLRQIRIELGITNIDIVRARIEEYAPGGLYTSVTARALAGLDRLWCWAQPLLAPGGRLLALKGAVDHDEIRALEAWPMTYQTHMLRIPGIDAQRCLITVQDAA